MSCPTTREEAGPGGCGGKMKDVLDTSDAVYGEDIVGFGGVRIFAIQS